MPECEVSSSKPKALLGTDEATLDGKGRLLISKKKRERLGDGFAMCINEMGCLCAYPADRWQAFLDMVEATSPMNHGRRVFAREVLGTADDELDFDDQGRVVVPAKLRKAAKIMDEVLIIGCYDHLEIWAKAEHEKFVEFGDAYQKARREEIEGAFAEMEGKYARPEAS